MLLDPGLSGLLGYAIGIVPSLAKSRTPKKDDDEGTALIFDDVIDKPGRVGYCTSHRSRKQRYSMVP